MKKISSKSYIEAQQVRFDPKRLNAPKDNPQIKTFQNAFNALNVTGITALSEQDAMILNDIQDKIRKKLRSVSFQVSS